MPLFQAVEGGEAWSCSETEGEESPKFKIPVISKAKCFNSTAVENDCASKRVLEGVEIDNPMSKAAHEN